MDGAVAGAVPYLRNAAGGEVDGERRSRRDRRPELMRQQTSAERQSNNKRTGLVLLSIVLVFFVGIIVRRWLFGG